nr:hypothetical protein [Pandoravirus massiliensis]
MWHCCSALFSVSRSSKFLFFSSWLSLFGRPFRRGGNRAKKEIEKDRERVCARQKQGSRSGTAGRKKRRRHARTSFCCTQYRPLVRHPAGFSRAFSSTALRIERHSRPSAWHTHTFFFSKQKKNPKARAPKDRFVRCGPRATQCMAPFGSDFESQQPKRTCDAHLTQPTHRQGIGTRAIDRRQPRAPTHG